MGHAFEPDHLLAVGNLISRRDTLAEALRDSIYWALGHTTTLVVVGSVIMLGRVTFLTSDYFEAAVRTAAYYNGPQPPARPAQALQNAAHRPAAPLGFRHRPAARPRCTVPV